MAERKGKKMSDYTPGPWRSLDGGEIGEIFIDSDEGPVADLVKPERGGSKRVEANARLIAQSPRMFEMLKLMVDTGFEVGDEYGDTYWAISEKIRELAREAIYKAEEGE